MAVNNLEDLADPGSWDFERAERRPGVRAPRAVVSVAFSREDFERVVQSAEVAGKRTSEFIREAAIERATGGHRRAAAYVSFTGSRGAAPLSRVMFSETKVSGPTSDIGQEDAVTA